MFRETIVVFILFSHTFAANDWIAGKKCHQIWSDSALIDYRVKDLKTSEKLSVKDCLNAILKGSSAKTYLDFLKYMNGLNLLKRRFYGNNSKSKEISDKKKIKEGKDYFKGILMKREFQ